MQVLLPVLESTNDSVEEVFQAQMALSKQLFIIAVQREQLIPNHSDAPSLAPTVVALRQE